MPLPGIERQQELGMDDVVFRDDPSFANQRIYTARKAGGVKCAVQVLA
jgi:hypothetical protein